MKLFVSYRRNSWPFTQRLAEKLERRLDAEIFIDYKSIDEARFAASIMKHLSESQAVLLIVSDTTFAPHLIHRERDWVRREIRRALELDKPIIQAFVDGQPIPGELPSDIEAIREMQGVNFYSDYFNAALIKLVGFIVKATPIKRLKPQNRKVQVERSLREVREGLANIETGKGDVKALLAEFQSYLTSIEEFMDVKQIPGALDLSRPKDAETARPPQQIALPYSLKILDDLVKSLAATIDDADYDSEKATPYDFLNKGTTPPSLRWLEDLSRNGGTDTPDDLLNWLLPPPDLPP